MKSISIKLGIGFNTLNQHLNILKQKGLVSFDETKITLATNKDMKVKTENIIFVPKQIEKYSDIKIFLNSIPFLSKLNSQKKVINKKEHYRYIRYKGDNNYFLNKKELKLYLKLRKECNLKSLQSNNDIVGSISKVLECINRKSSATAVKYKQFLKKFGVIDYENSLETLFENVSNEFYIYLRRNDFKEHKYCFFMNGSIYKRNPTKYSIGVGIS